MHSSEVHIPAFLIKLWKLVEDPSCDDLITWSESGSTFIILDQATFAKNLLPQYFKHNNMASFIRQLNMYGFRKVASTEKNGLNCINDQIEFYNRFFEQGEQSQLSSIKRKINSNKTNSTEQVSEPVPKPAPKPRVSDPSDILTDLTSIQEKQETMNTLLVTMKKENELLWRELSTLRKKHKTQEQIIQKVIQFLVSIVQSGKQNIGMKRSVARMIQNANSPDNTTSHLDILAKASDLFITVPSSEKLSSPVGPVIHEVTDLDFEEASSSSTESLDHPYNRRKVRKVPSPLGKSVSNQSSCSMTSLEPTGLLSPESISVLSPSESNSELILGVKSEFAPAGYINVPDIASVVSISDDRNSTISPDLASLPLSPAASVSNVISIPEDHMTVALADSVSSLISVPEGNDVISLLETSGCDKMEEFSPEGASVPFSSSDLVLFQNFSAIGGDNFGSSSAVNDADVLKTPAVDKEVALFSGKNRSIKKELFINGSNYVDPDELDEPDGSNILPQGNIVAKKAFSNHVEDVEQDLDWLQNQLSPEVLNVDPSLLLALFSPDDDETNMSLGNKFASEIALKNIDPDVIGKEVVQFNPSILDIPFDENSFFDDYYNNLEPSFSNDQIDIRNDENLSSIRNKLQNLKREPDNVFSSCSGTSPLKRSRVTPVKTKRRS